jgi:hypothetical protein
MNNNDKVSTFSTPNNKKIEGPNGIFDEGWAIFAMAIVFTVSVILATREMVPIIWTQTTTKN